ncbi:MAG: metallophosphoesterase family protein, partial [Patescibacteria group bacterium]
MKIAIISDSHDNIPNIEKFLGWAKENKIEMIIHCGDIASGETVKYLSENFKGKIHLVYGNMDEPYRDEIY